MISLTCTSCAKVLEIDDAFAGGVCRCQHCGTIQTVPTAPKPGVPTPIPKTLYQNRARGAGARQDSADLQSLADAVASSSGLARSALKVRATEPVAPAPKASRLPMVLTVVVVGIVLIALIGWLTYLHYALSAG